MRSPLFIVAATTCLLALAACRKNGHSPNEWSKPDCLQLQQAVTSSDTAQVKLIISQYINTLSAKAHTQENITRLVKAINQCGNQATLVCFGCIKTLPVMSEIRISYAAPTGAAHQVIDISEANNKMIFVAMHP